MNTEYVQNLRYKLQKRVRRLNSTDYITFHFVLKQFWNFLREYPIFIGILEVLAHRCETSESYANKITGDSQSLIFDNEIENAAVAYHVIKKCAESDDKMLEVKIGYNYCKAGKHNDSLEYFKYSFLEVLYEYLDENLDDRKAILALLLRYKHKCEWFQREHLFKKWESNTQKGEKLLALDLYEYLHDQGLDFTIEPSSISGEVDLISSQNSEDPLIADTKIFDSTSRGVSYIAKGFNQIYIYTLDYNQPFGYLIIYNVSDKDIRFSLSQQGQSTPFVIHNNKTIFIIVIDIYPHKSSASKRGALETIEITEKELITIVNKKDKEH